MVKMLSVMPLIEAIYEIVNFLLSRGANGIASAHYAAKRKGHIAIDNIFTPLLFAHLFNKKINNNNKKFFRIKHVADFN